MPGQLGRRVPRDFTHVERYPLTAETTPAPPTPVTIGVNWYSAFDTPEQDDRGRWWIGRGSLGSVRGGHCVCIPASPGRDRAAWWTFYDQGNEGACVGFGSSRMMSLLNRRRYHARWLWDQAKLGDGFDDTRPGDDNGTTVYAAMDVLRTRGHVRWRRAYARVDETGDYRSRDREEPNAGAGISANRWATSVDQMRAVLSAPEHDRRQAFPVLNSWGRAYPHVVWLPYTVMERLLAEDGEVALVTDR